MANDQERSAFPGVAVLCGGPGGEREVSLNSGRNAHQALLRAGVDSRLVVVPAESPEETLESLSCRVAVLMLHGRFGEDGTAQRILERRGVVFTGSDSAAAALAMDKAAAKGIFRRNDIPTPNWAVGDSLERLVEAVEEARLSYPLFVKPNSGGSSVGVSPVWRPEYLPAAARLALADDCLALAEEMVVGRELTVGWLDGEILPIIELRADGIFYDYRAKYLSEATRYACPADLPERIAAEVGRVADLAIRALGTRDIGRADIMLGPGGPMILEVNALPGFTSHSLVPMAAGASGMSLENLCLRLVGLAGMRSAGCGGAVPLPAESIPLRQPPAARRDGIDWESLCLRLFGRAEKRAGAS
ncbi:MAG: D-alanine--D-alanine ligase [Planctomycetota bacterium]|jgi:D-alanine-D-alanine ligase|nr:D-alanine--D-alanine ligase [Planctomycetota bacterium]